MQKQNIDCIHYLIAMTIIQTTIFGHFVYVVDMLFTQFKQKNIYNGDDEIQKWNGDSNEWQPQLNGTFKK